jgi:uncharacterized metal-binding protein
MSNNKNFTPETPFQRTTDNSLVYCLKHGGWRKGKEVMVNDVAISIQVPHGFDPEDLEHVAETIERALNSEFPAQEEA